MLWAKPLWVAGLCGLLASAGCGRSGGNGSGQAVVPPDRVIAEFLEAVRTGDDHRAADLLTPLARRKTAEMEMVVAPPGSETARYAVQGVTLIEGGVKVDTDWTDFDNSGHPHTDHIVWLLRQESEGWRIAGMATQLYEQEILLNFEDPVDMLAKQRLAEEEIARRDHLPSAETESAADQSARTVR